MEKQIWFDMDGTIANLYSYAEWKECLVNEDTTPYEVAEPMVNMSALARLIHKVQSLGYEVGIVSWGSRNAGYEFDKAVHDAKCEWLGRHLPSVQFDHLVIMHNGIPKSVVGNGILFDDEEANRNEWKGIAYPPEKIMEILKGL